MRGEVIAVGSGARVAYATVELQPLFGPRFADAAGRFAFAPVPPGRYHLMVRQIGHVPYAAPLEVGDSGINIQVGLAPLFVQLPPVTVTGRAACTSPGPPDPGREPELAALFDQLRENAARFRVLSDAYPFRYWVERVVEDVDSNRALAPVSVDTLQYLSTEHTDYRPGRVVHTVRGPRGYERSMRLPSLADLANNAFHRTHCFAFAGIDTIGELRLIRLAFRVADRLRSPDVDGTAFLDEETRVLYRLSLTLTRAERAARGVRSVTAEAFFGELLPTLVVPARVEGTTELQERGGRVGQVERQRLVGVEFISAAPPGRQ